MHVALLFSNPLTFDEFETERQVVSGMFGSTTCRPGCCTTCHSQWQVSITSGVAQSEVLPAVHMCARAVFGSDVTGCVKSAEAVICPRATGIARPGSQVQASSLRPKNKINIQAPGQEDISCMLACKCPACSPADLHSPNDSCRARRRRMGRALLAPGTGRDATTNLTTRTRAPFQPHWLLTEPL